MAEYSKDKIYFLKIRKDFFQSHEMRVLEGMDGGERYELLYLKLMLESASHNGFLRFSQEIAYTPKMIASLTNTDLDTVIVALKALEGLGLVTTTDEGSLFIPKVPELTGITTEGAEKKRLQRKGTNGGQVGDICPPDNRLESLDVRQEILDERPQIETCKNSVLTSKKQGFLLSILLDRKFLEDYELQDYCWDKFLDDYVNDRRNELGKHEGWLDAKIKVIYVMNSICHYQMGPEDRNGKRTYKQYVDPEVMETIGNKFTWFVASMKKAIDQQKQVDWDAIADEYTEEQSDDDDDKPF